MSNQINEQKIDRLAELLNVLADPIRMRIILVLTNPASISSLRQRLQIGQITLFHHLVQLQDNGFLKSERSGEEIYYSLTDITLNRAVKLLLAKQA